MKVRGVLINVESNPGRADVVEIEAELDKFYAILRCNTIDIVIRKIGGRAFNIVCDDEGLLKDSPIISAVSKLGQPTLVGNLFICNHYKSNLVSLSDADIEHIHNHIMVSMISDPKDKNKTAIRPLLVDVEHV